MNFPGNHAASYHFVYLSYKATDNNSDSQIEWNERVWRWSIGCHMRQSDKPKMQQISWALLKNFERFLLESVQKSCRLVFSQRLHNLVPSKAKRWSTWWRNPECIWKLELIWKLTFARSWHVYMFEVMTCTVYQSATVVSKHRIRNSEIKVRKYSTLTLRNVSMLWFVYKCHEILSNNCFNNLNAQASWLPSFTSPVPSWIVNLHFQQQRQSSVACNSVELLSREFMLPTTKTSKNPMRVVGG